jgi:hypothetical protein
MESEHRLTLSQGNGLGELPAERFREMWRDVGASPTIPSSWSAGNRVFGRRHTR